MKFIFESIPFCFNPFKRAEHNGIAGLPRILFHLAHTALGMGVWLALAVVLPHLFAVTVPVWGIAVIVALVAVWDKCMWIDWANRKFYPWVPPASVNMWDFTGDMILTLLPILITVCPWAIIPAYYAASLLSDPY